MAMEIVVTTGRWNNDPASRSFMDYLQRNQDTLNLGEAIVYYDFPAYVDYESETTRPDILVLSPDHGFIAIRFFDESACHRSGRTIEDIDSGISDFSSHLYSRLLRSRELRHSRNKTLIDVYPLIFVDDARSARSINVDDLDSKVCKSLEAVSKYIKSIKKKSLPRQIIDEVRSVVEGAKALSRPQKRVIENPNAQPLAVSMSALEKEIANFDEKQRRIALVDVGGPARIRGLAGCGKTVILAMKAAHLHLNNPDAMILFTFYTKSLRATIKSLVTKFYRHYSETDPNWKHLHILHGWGGSNIPGVYSDACRRVNLAPLNLQDAKAIAGRGETAFEAACKQLNQTNKVKEFYDYVLIDEGQDFPGDFYRLCYSLAKGDRDKKSIVWAYDELQDIMNVKIRQPDALFGRDKDGISYVDLDRSSTHVPPGATNDAVLSKAYRNQRNILVTAHAMGFGVYGEIVQMLEDAEHWKDVGYDVLSGPLVKGKAVSVVRPADNSPLEVPEVNGYPLLKWELMADFDAEVRWVATQIQEFISGGLSPEELMVVCLDDRNAKTYLSRISKELALAGIASNNVIADPYNEPPFTLTGKVSLSTVYRAKGNEASAVFAVGVDAVETKSRSGRNKIFTAFTRSKAWLRVSGVGQSAAKIFSELKIAYETAPAINFIMPDLREIETIQRGFSKKQAAARAAREQYINKLKAAGFSDEEIEEELQQVSSGY
ncbi:DEAD/DEAH box helicase [Methylocystis iwaonis]|uniref:DEAD/DEAH box helicase n=1 Tax=Methylocystis iwaonis TaxID=2885079 RepID=UPI002E7AFA06|nr:ATP-binding domain-containing protein [Methylocystis iwaonis]